jgi:hypothetical protein
MQGYLLGNTYVPYPFHTSHPSTTTSISSSVVYNPTSTIYNSDRFNPNLINISSVFPPISYVDQFGHPLSTYLPYTSSSYQLPSLPLQIFPDRQALQQAQQAQQQAQQLQQQHKK